MSVSIDPEHRNQQRATRDAVGAFRARGWRVGTLLASSKWKRPRRIVENDGMVLWLKDIGTKAPPMSIRNLPDDVREVAA